MYIFNVPKEVLNQISINQPVCKYDNRTYVLVPTGVNNVYEILRRMDNWVGVYADYINFKDCEHTNHYLVKDGRIFTRDQVKKAITELKHLVINDLMSEGKKIKFDWENISSENDLRNKDNLATMDKYLNLSRVFDEIKSDYVFLRTESLNDALSKYIYDNIFTPEIYYDKNYESAIVNIALLWLSNQISTSTAIYQFYELYAHVQIRMHNLTSHTQIDKNDPKSIEPYRLKLIEFVKFVNFVACFYNDMDPKIQEQKDLYQYLLDKEIKTVKVNLNNKNYKMSVAAIIRLLRGIELPIESTIINFDDIETITYRKKILYQK